jgi:hypothetical protein
VNVTLGFYKKHLAFWAVLGLLFWGGTNFWTGRNISADYQSVTAYDQGFVPYQLSIAVAENGQTKLNGIVIPKAVTPLRDIDQLRLLLIDKKDVPIYAVNATITLPPTVNANMVKITPRLVHNYTSFVQTTIINSQTVQLNAQDINPGASLSVEMDFPKNTLKLPLLTRFQGSLTNQSFYWWLGLALIFPLISIIVLLVTVFGHIKSLFIKPNQEIAGPPLLIPPAVAQIIVEGRLNSKSIAATLVDLAKRGYLIIGYHNNDFKFGKHKSFNLPSQQTMHVKPTEDEVGAILAAVASIKDSTDIRLFERLILSKIFTNEEMITDKKEIEFRVGHRLFSEKIAQAYTEVYALATSLGYFVQNPAAYHKKFKTLGLTLFFIGLIGFAIGALWFPDPKTMLFFWIGMIIASLFILFLGSRLPILNNQGIEAYKQWLGFKKYLADPAALEYSEEAAAQFEQYLPYAIAFGVPKQWTARFRNFPFIEPVWFSTDKQMVTLENFDQELFPLIDWVGAHLSGVRTPIID